MEKKEWLNLQTHKLMSDQENPERDSVILGQVSTLQPAPGDTRRMDWQCWVSHSGPICFVLKMTSLRVLVLVGYTSGTGMLRPGVLLMYSQNWLQTCTWPWLFCLSQLSFEIRFCCHTHTHWQVPPASLKTYWWSLGKVQPYEFQRGPGECFFFCFLSNSQVGINT